VPAKKPKKAAKAVKAAKKPPKRKEPLYTPEEFLALFQPPPSVEDVDDFCEHSVESCVFCGLKVRYGHNDHSDVLRHDYPPCVQFNHCDNIKQFAMFTILKMRSDAGQLVRN
jgi:hypothetical protein